MSFDTWFLARARVTAKQHGRASLDDKMTFFQQFGSLLASGTPLLRAIRIAGEQNQSRVLREAMDEVAERVASGTALHVAIEATTDMFPMHWVAMIATGEATGKLDEVLVDLNRQIRESAEARSKFVGSMIYPCVLIFVAVLVVLAMLWFVVPTFGQMFKEMGAELPGITVFVLDLSDQVAAYGLYVLGGFAAGGFALFRWLKTEERATRISIKRDGCDSGSRRPGHPILDVSIRIEPLATAEKWRTDAGDDADCRRRIRRRNHPTEMRSSTRKTEWPRVGHWPTASKSRACLHR